MTPQSTHRPGGPGGVCLQTDSAGFNVASSVRAESTLQGIC